MAALLGRRSSISAAFTLLELLVVLGVIALLMAMLVPNLVEAREKARRIVCAGNLRSCGGGLYAYAADNMGDLPYRNAGGGTTCTRYVDAWGPFSATNTFAITHLDVPTTGMVYNSIPNPWGGSLSSYISNAKVLTCPAVGAPPITDPSNVWGSHGGVQVGASPFYTKFNINYMLFWGQPHGNTTFSSPDFRAFINGHQKWVGGNLIPQEMPSRIDLSDAKGVNPVPSSCPIMQDVVYANFATSKYYSQTNPDFYNRPSDPVTFVQANHLAGGSGGSGSSTNGYNSFVATPDFNASDSTGFVLGGSFPSLVAGGNILYWDGHVEWLKAGQMQDAGWPDDNNGRTRHVMSDQGPWHP